MAETSERTAYVIDRVVTAERSAQSAEKPAGRRA